MYSGFAVSEKSLTECETKSKKCENDFSHAYINRYAQAGGRDPCRKGIAESEKT